jgi:2-amino-1-hydroxyethylphosphonate dioxygenase (glycine-forming)
MAKETQPTDPESRARSILDLLARSGEIDYIGEPVSQLEHALQCAFWAKKARATDEVVLAALLHDVGHICGPPDAPQMAGYGVLHHEERGAELLIRAGLSETVAALVEGHIQAKRYLIGKNPGYSAQLSEASKRTLEFQGGPMRASEIESFERDPLMKDKLRLRQWDELAKESGLRVPGLEAYREILSRHLQDQSRDPPR